jgi:hypothetical protein
MTPMRGQYPYTAWWNQVSDSRMGQQLRVQPCEHAIKRNYTRSALSLTTIMQRMPDQETLNGEQVEMSCRCNLHAFCAVKWFMFCNFSRETSGSAARLQPVELPFCAASLHYKPVAGGRKCCTARVIYAQAHWIY